MEKRRWGNLGELLKWMLFVIFFFTGLETAVVLLYPSNAGFRSWKGFYALEKGEAELLVVGSSHAYSTFDPAVISGMTGMRSYILSANSLNTVQAYYNVKEALRYQRPKAIILEASSLDNNDNWRNSATPDRDWKKESNIDGMRFGTVKLEAVKEQYWPENWCYAMNPVVRCHSNWENITTIGSNLAFYTGDIQGYTSFQPSVSSMSEETAAQYAEAPYNPEEWVISETNEYYFHELAQLCRKEEIPLYLVMAPMYDVYIHSIYYDSWKGKIEALAESEEVYYLDCNESYNEIGLTAEDFEDLFSNIHHLNAAGAEKVTRFVMGTLYGQEKE